MINMTDKRLALIKSVVIAFSLATIMLFAMTIKTKASETVYTLNANIYESMGDESDHNTSNEKKVNRFSYGGSSLGSMSLSGSFNDLSSFNGFAAYSATGQLTIGYQYKGEYQSGDKEKWNIISDDGKEVSGQSLSKKIGEGTIIVQKSTNGLTWENAVDPIRDVFTSDDNDLSNLYTISDEELKRGTYYRVFVAYGMKHYSHTEEVWWILPDKDIYDYIYCTEIYQFYACYGINTVNFRDLVSRDNLRSGATVANGFIIDKNGSSSSVQIAKDGGSPTVVSGLRTSVYKPGDYVITVKTPLNQEFKYTITVSGGLSTAALSPVVYENAKKKGYSEDNPVFGDAAFGFRSHTGITLAHNSEDQIIKAQKNGFDAYGITGSNVYLFLQLKNEEELKSANWETVSDTWGKKSSELIEGAQVGQVDTGAIIIQKSKDGIVWENEDLGRYANGLYTTDYENHYGYKGDILVYRPSGQEILKGVYIRVLYAYELKQDDKDIDNRYLEKYEFFLCSNELSAVTFHNISAEGILSEVCEEYDDATAEICCAAETMLSGAYTISGFSIDTSLNPTVTFSVKRDGISVGIPTNRTFTQTGKYQIYLTSAVGANKTIELYVDRMSTAEALQFYFGDAFISGKRIYDEGAYAVYEGGLTTYKINAVDMNHLPLGGVIKNLTSGEETEIAFSRDKKTGSISAPGLYEAVLSTGSDASIAGDVRTFTFRFMIIPNGTAPGPIVNQNNLCEYAKSTISDAYPVYYGLTYPSASKGNITLAFATREAALKYGYDYERGMVEKQTDGSYRYTGSFIVSQKEKYDSAWDLADACNYFAEQAIQPLYFDLSEEFTVLTLKDSVIENTSNLRTLELNRSVTIFAPGQQDELTQIDALPIISPKPYSYLFPGENGIVSRGKQDFEFIRDKYGCDSDSVIITDCQGNEYEIAYHLGVGVQLERNNCPSGIVTITERTVYGDSASYQAVYIAPGENTAALTLSCFNGGEKESLVFTQENDGSQIEAEAFSIEAVKDSLDPCGLIIVSDTNGQTEAFYAEDQVMKGVWIDPGVYEVKVVNRLGYSFVIKVNVVETEYAIVSFTGYGTDETQDILTTMGAKNVKLPELIRCGYSLIGFEDEKGNLYEDEIPEISFKGTIALNAIWKAKQYTITLQDQEGETINTLVVDFGKEYELPYPSLPKDCTFLNWTCNGKPIENNLITLSSEGDITLVANVTRASSGQEPTEAPSSNAKDNETDSDGITIVAIICVALVIVFGLAGIVLYRKKRFHDTEKLKRQAKPVSEETEENDGME